MTSKGKKLYDYIMADFWSCGTGLIDMTREQQIKLENEYVVDFIKAMSDEELDRITKEE